MNLWQDIRKNFGLFILATAFTLALLRVLALQSHEAISTKKVIKMVHWQLEAAIQEAIDEIVSEYSILHPGVEVQQILIGERSYGSWVTTRLIGNTAPDLIEVGMGASPDLWDQLFLRYFLPLSNEILKPNPYNKGTRLEWVPWNDTYYDGMQGGFVCNLLDYYSVPSSGATVRLFYNKNLFKKITGLDAPPHDFRQFIDVCECIKKHGRAMGQELIPIAGSGKYNARFMFDRFEQGVNSSLLSTVDVNRDGEVTVEECAIALVGGSIDFRDPRIAAMFQGREYYIHEFQPAFFPADRMDAAFLFIQQKALMIASGTWDAASYIRQADFEIGVCDFPLPSKNDPEFGRFVEGPAAEAMQGGFAFGVYRLSPRADLALDFLKFMSSQRMNDLFNRRIKWIPMIRGNKPDPSIAPFWPHLDGVKAGIFLSVGPQNAIALDELLNLHSAGRIDFEGFLQRYLPKFIVNCDLHIKLDRPRASQLACNQDEFRKTSERVFCGLMSRDQEKAMAILENQLSHRFNDTEMFLRYADVRTHAKPPVSQ